MSYILHIESATKNCSISIAKNGKNIALVEQVFEKYAHSEKLLLYIEKAISNAQIQKSDLSAVAVSKGPGSYTGLRIGVSLAKGLCFALDIPLISAPTTQVLAQTFLENNDLEENDIICSTIDARRMEVYRCFYNQEIDALGEIEAEVVGPSFVKKYESNKVYFIGDSVKKIADTVSHTNFEAIELFPSAVGLEKISHQKFEKNDFEDVAYFEPYYLKEFIAG